MAVKTTMQDFAKMIERSRQAGMLKAMGKTQPGPLGYVEIKVVAAENDVQVPADLWINKAGAGKFDPHGAKVRERTGKAAELQKAIAKIGELEAKLAQVTALLDDAGIEIPVEAEHE